MVALYAATRPDRVRALVLSNPAPPFAPEHREQFGKKMTSRRSPEDADELEHIKASAEYEAGNVAAVERYYQVLYAPFFNDRQVALSTH
jgi:pimeloyl-ACP methyl ester carboxylesterase